MRKGFTKTIFAVLSGLILALASVWTIAVLNMRDEIPNPNISTYIGDSTVGNSTDDIIQSENQNSNAASVNSNNLNIERKLSGHDEDNDGTDDFDDIIYGARKDVENKPVYRSNYYDGGYPPDTEGVCTDVIWRAFFSAGYDLKKMVDKDIAANLESYPRVMEGGRPDPNIDFRRVPNLAVFFSRYAVMLTTVIIPGNKENLEEWQGGDIVVFGGNIKHIAIVSDIRRPDGVPYIIHNAGPYTAEEDAILDWNEISKISHHFRWITD